MECLTLLSFQTGADGEDVEGCINKGGFILFLTTGVLFITSDEGAEDGARGCPSF